MPRLPYQRQVRLNQTGVAHMALGLAALVVVIVAASGYLVYQHRSHTVSLEGTLNKTACTSTANCSTYTLETTDAKTYELAVPSLPAGVTAGSEVSVEGTTTPAHSSNVNVQTITPSSVSGGTGSKQDIPPVYPHDITFTSTITKDTCSSVDNAGAPPVGDVGCSITTQNGWTIQAVHGNARPQAQPGSLENAPAFDQTWVGKSVSVYAQASAYQQASILTASKYYVKF